jgi:putative colanic acid biosynthesis acetyltransferase WcaF
VSNLDIQACRRVRNYTPLEYVLRGVWWVLGIVFRCSPRPLWGWRNAILRLLGAEVGHDVRIFQTARIFAPWNLVVGSETSIGDGAIIYNLGRVTLGNRVTVSQRAHLCAGTHDYTDPTMPLRKLPITIGDDSWIAAEAFIGPQVAVGRNSVVGARAVVVRDVPDGVVVVGNPAKVVKAR